MLKGNEYVTYLHLSPAKLKVDRWKEEKDKKLKG